ncbi:MAG: Uma2 family endonuclease [Sphingomonadaceae bacterium]
MTAQQTLARPRPAKLTVDDFLLLDRAGAFGKYQKTELIDGQVIVVNAEYAEHFTVKNRLYRRIADACDGLGRGVQAWSEGSIEIPPHNVPQPDIFITDEEPSRGLVKLETVLLVVEVAASSLEQDLGPKLKAYATAGVAEYWVVDVKGGAIHQLWAPAGETYAEKREVKLGQRIEAATVDGLKVETEGLC